MNAAEVTSVPRFKRRTYKRDPHVPSAPFGGGGEEEKFEDIVFEEIKRNRR